MVSRNYQDLVVWQKAMDLVESIYHVTRGFPKEEVYGLTSQIRRAAVSIASNVAEGQGRRTSRDFLRFLAIAHGSLREVETQILIAERLKYINDTLLNQLMKQTSEVGRLLNGLMRSLENRS